MNLKGTGEDYIGVFGTGNEGRKMVITISKKEKEREEEREKSSYQDTQSLDSI